MDPRSSSKRRSFLPAAACLVPILAIGAPDGRCADGAQLLPGGSVELEAGTATLERLETLPFIESEYSRRYRYDSWENPKLKELRERYGLDRVIAPGKDEFDRQLLLLDWVHHRFRKFGRPTKEVRGALEILDGIEEGHAFFCSQYAEVLVSAAASLGWVDRPLALRRHRGAAKVGGSTEHSVTEIWSNQHSKWVMLDPTSDLYLEKEGKPLDAVEIREEWFRRDGAGLVFVVGKERRRLRKADLPVVLGRFEGFGDLALHPDELDTYGFIGFIPNTDLMDRGYDYGGMFIVQDALCDGTRWHVRTVPANPLTDPYFPIGQAALSLRAEGGALRVGLETLTPNFKGFEVRIDGGPWRPSEKEFRWDVRAGRNRLEARSVNRFEVAGPISIAEVEIRKR